VRKAPKAKEKLSLKDAMAISISLIALSISIGTAYVNLFRQTEHVESLVLDTPDVSFEDAAIRITGPIRITFVNLGTRAVAVASITFRLHQTQEEGKATDCFGDNISDIEITEEPFVLKPGEIAIKKMSSKAFDRDEVEYLGPNLERPAQQVAVGCLAVRMVTSHGYDYVGLWFGTYRKLNKFDKQPTSFNRIPPLFFRPFAHSQN
jgi:hypothetical protein